MSFSSPHPGQPADPTQPAPPAYSSQPQRERVALGLLAAVVGVLGGLALTVLVAQLGYTAAITSFAIAFGAAFAYQAAAGRSARAGLVPLVLLIVLGVVTSYFAVIASNLWDVAGDLGISGSDRVSFIREFLLDSEVLDAASEDLPYFAIFGLLGVVGVVRQLLANR